MNSSNVMKPQVLYRTYSQRWVVLASVCLLALSNATQWIAFAPVHDAANLFYCNNLNNLSNNEIMKGVEGSSCDIETWSSQIFQLVGVITGLFGMFITDRYGIRVSCHFGAALNLCGSIIRFISSLPLLEKSCRLIFLFFGQTISAMSQPFFLCLSPKVAEYWFGENQRALANSLSFIANPFGVFLGSITPITFSFLFEKKQNDNLQQQTELLILYVNLLLMILSAFTMLFCLLVTRQKPPTPPSASSDFDKPEFFKGLCLLFNSKFFLIQTLTFGMAFALQWSIFFTASKQLLILGFDKTKVNSGYLLASSAFAGTLSTIFGGWIVDRTKKFNEFIKFSYIGIAVSAIALDTLLHNPSVFSSIPVILIATLFIFFILMGIFAIPVFPISLELGVESTFPIAEASSSGILVIAGQLQLFLLTFIMQSLESVGWIYGGKRNYKLAIDFWALTAVLGAVFAFLLLRPRYNRLEYEQNARILINKCNEIN